MKPDGFRAGEPRRSPPEPEPDSAGLWVLVAAGLIGLAIGTLVWNATDPEARTLWRAIDEDLR